ncbi:MAG: FAD-dependent oxidoreductase [Elusimicrobiota bacterium]
MKKVNGKVVILGAGLTGLSTAYALHANNDCIVFEKEKTYGGLCRSVNINGFKFDFTGHLLHFKNQEVRKFVTNIVSSGLVSHRRNSWVHMCGKYTPAPFQVNTFGLPAEIVRDCVMGYVDTLFNRSKSGHEVRSFYDWSIKYFGKGISRHFMFPYNTKLWRINPKLMSPEGVGNYVPKTSLEDILTGALTDQSKNSKGYNADFYYPKRGGIQSLVDGFAARVRDKISFSDEVLSIDCNNKTVLLSKSGWVKYNTLVSTIPLPEFVRRIKDAPGEIVNAGKALRSTKVLCINIGVARNISDKHWIYFPEDKYNYYRVGFQNNFSVDVVPNKNYSSLYVEVAFHQDERINTEKHVKDAVDGLIIAGIIRPSDKIVVLQAVIIPYAYVVYDFNRGRAVAKIQKYLNRKSIHSVGRYGAWEYSAMEDAIIHGQKVAGMIVNG